MRISGYAAVALLMMRQKPVRTLLSVLGIYVGVLALAVILALHEGMRRSVNELYRTEGAAVFLVRPGFDQASQKVGTLTLSDIAMLKSLRGVRDAIPRLSAAKEVRGAQKSAKVNLAGVDDEFFSIYRVPLKAGRSFLPGETKTKAPVLVLTEAAARELFPLQTPVGALLNVEGQVFEVIGVALWSPEITDRARFYEEPGALVAPGWLLGPDSAAGVPMIDVHVDPEVPQEDAVAMIRAELTHGDKARESLYRIESLQELLQREMQFSARALNTLLAIAAVSLLVGGIGVANVMLTAVTERTREIGIRKALGAERKDILLQFLVESCLLSASGGLLAILSAWLGVAFLPVLFAVKVPLALPALPTAGCLLLTTAIGLVAGLYPASRAADCSPAEALRFE